MATGPIYSRQCKVCNSVFRNRIEELSLQGFNPQKIFTYLQAIQDPGEQKIVEKEQIKPSAIRRHLDNHFQKEEAVKVKLAETHSRIETSREMLQNGVSIAVDKINSLCHMVDVAMIKMEEVESDVTINNKLKYQLTVQFMNTAKGLIESLAKLTGELKQEGTIDINFFTTEISVFVDIVLATIRSVDKQMGLKGELETKFSLEFQERWKDYRQKQTAILNGESKPRVQNLVNTFNDGV